MPLTTCPDCGREVSTAAPVCIHCGRPFMDPAASPAPAAPPVAQADKPMPGIVTALVLGVLTIVWMLLRDEPATPQAEEVGSLVTAVHMLGNVVLVIAALLALAGRRAAHGWIRSLSVVMILAICGLMVVVWSIVETVIAESPPLPQGGRGMLGAIFLLSTVFQLAPWMLYLYLFRSSRYP